MKPTKVWGITLTHRASVEFTKNYRAQVRAVVSAPSRTKAAALFGIGMYEMRNYSSITGNEEELRLAALHPGRPMWTGNDYKHPRVWRFLDNNEVVPGSGEEKGC